MEVLFKLPMACRPDVLLKVPLACRPDVLLELPLACRPERFAAGAQRGSSEKILEKFLRAAARGVCEPEVPHGVGGSIIDAHEGADGNHHAVRDVESAEE